MLRELPLARPSKAPIPRLPNINAFECGSSGPSLIFPVHPLASRAFPSSPPAPPKSSTDGKGVTQKVEGRTLTCPPRHEARSANCWNALASREVEAREPTVTLNRD